jgi:MFS family permease
MRSAYASIAALLVSVFGVLAGNGVMTTLLPIRAQIEGFPGPDIGFMGSAYFAGMLAGATLTPWLVQRLGHIKAFGASSALGALCILAFGMAVHPLSWILIRGLSGFFLAGIYAIVESYLQGKAENRVRGRIVGIYSIVQYGGWAVGGQFMRLSEPTSFLLFGVAACIVTLFLIPLVLIEDNAAPPGSQRARMNLPWLYRTSPVGFVCVMLIGFANGPFWSLTPVFAVSLGLSPIDAGTLMTAITIGAAAFQFPVGRISDAMDRRRVLIGLTSLTAICEICLYAFGARMLGWPLILTGFIQGGLLSTQYYVTSAHTNDRTGRENAVGVASALLFLYCIGAILGPITASLAMERFGPAVLYLHNAGIHVAIAVFVIMRMRRSAAPLRTVSDIELQPK